MGKLDFETEKRIDDHYGSEIQDLISQFQTIEDIKAPKYNIADIQEMEDEENKLKSVYPEHIETEGLNKQKSDNEDFTKKKKKNASGLDLQRADSMKEDMQDDVMNERTRKNIQKALNNSQISGVDDESELRDEVGSQIIGEEKDERKAYPKYDSEMIFDPNAINEPVEHLEVKDVLMSEWDPSKGFDF